jgi:hypothetical protein
MNNQMINLPKIYIKPKEQRNHDDLLSNNTTDLIPPLSASTSSLPSTKMTTKSRCSARVFNGNQCNRGTKENDEYCACHNKHRPYGRFDGPIEGKKFLNLPKKRGPRFKNTKEYNLTDLDQDLYIATQLVEIDDKQYLYDKHGILYTNDTECNIVGRQIDDEHVIWFI